MNDEQTILLRDVSFPTVVYLFCPQAIPNTYCNKLQISIVIEPEITVLIE